MEDDDYGHEGGKKMPSLNHILGSEEGGQHYYVDENGNPIDMDMMEDDEDGHHMGDDDYGMEGSHEVSDSHPAL